MRILVTGGAGFIGSHLCDRLLADGHEVICVDSFFSGKKENIAHLEDHKRFVLITHDVRRPLSADRVGQIDRIYHLACPASPFQYQFDPVLTLETSIKGTQNMLELARRTGARLLYTSTSEAYGDPLQHPQKETYWGNVDPLGKRACYDEGKRAAETLCKDYGEQYGVDARIVRIFNTYGPRMMFNDGRVLSNFVLQALLGEDITVHGDGLQTRSFCYVSDLVAGLMNRMEVESDDWRPVNLGNPDERSILEMAKVIKEQTRSDSTIVHIDEKDIPDRAGDPKQRCPDISRAKALLDWEPLVPLNQGIEKTIVDFKKRLEHKSHIVVFIPAYLPLEGPAEKALSEVIARLPGWEFDIITAKLDRSLDQETHDDRVHIYRLGSGRILDKYFLPFRAAMLAKKMHKQHDYQIGWAIMASYGALASIFFSFLVGRKVPLILSLYEGNSTDRILKRGKIFSSLYRLIFRYAHRWQIFGEMNDMQRAWLEDTRHVQVVASADDYDLLAKRTKELFQEAEVLSSRL